MKYEIDTDKKTIKVLGEIKLDDLFKQVKVLFPDNRWKEYILSQVTEIVWQNPIVIDRKVPFYPNSYPWISTTRYEIKAGVISSTTEGILSNSKSSYCVEMN